MVNHLPWSWRTYSFPYLAFYPPGSFVVDLDLHGWFNFISVTLKANGTVGSIWNWILIINARQAGTTRIKNLGRHGLMVEKSLDRSASAPRVCLKQPLYPRTGLTHRLHTPGYKTLVISQNSWLRDTKRRPLTVNKGAFVRRVRMARQLRDSDHKDHRTTAFRSQNTYRLVSYNFPRRYYNCKIL